MNSVETKNSTPFTAIYNRFFGKITDDMYMELTPEDTVKDLRRLLIEAIPGFEFPRKDLYNYTLDEAVVPKSGVYDGDYIIGYVNDFDFEEEDDPKVIVEKSYFNLNLTSEEINILALIMKQAWVQRQVTSIENTRMKYGGADFKMTSQANHLAKLLNLLEESRRDSFHMQRLYKRRKIGDNGIYKSNWYILRKRYANEPS